MHKASLFCTSCGKRFDAGTMHYSCDNCGESLEVERIAGGAVTEGNPLEQTVLGRYREFYPYFEEQKELSLHEGFTPLIESAALAGETGISRLYLKNESQNPTWSFKDRGTLTGIMHAKGIGYQSVATVSSGNMAASVAAYGARAGLETFVFVSSSIPQEKIDPIAVFRQTLVAVDGRYDDLQRDTMRLCIKHGIYMLNSDVPFRVEGYKTLAFEVCEQTGFEVPDYVIVPTSAGGHIRGIEKGFQEFYEAGLISKIPRMVCVQAAGCAPIVRAFESGADMVERLEHPSTIAHGIENTHPLSGNQVLRVLRRNSGLALSVTDDEIISAQVRLAAAGVYVQPESAAAYAAVKKMSARRLLTAEDSVVCVLTGSGLKYNDSLKYHGLTHHKISRQDLDDFILQHRHKV